VLTRVLDLLLAAPPATVLSLNVPDRPVAEHRERRHARQVGTEPEAGTDSALLAAGHPTLTALRSVAEDEGPLVPDWLASADHVRVGQS
jgi:5'-nucleotidase